MPRGERNRFKPGNKEAKGGAREGAGRPPEWLREKCREHGEDVLQFLIDVATGKNMEQVVNDQGETIGVPASVKDRIKAAEIVLDRGYGKSEQKIEMNDSSQRRPSAEQLQAALECIEDIAKRVELEKGE